jgi:hypothetical protein
MLTRPAIARFSLALVSTAGLTSILALGGVSSCSTYSTYKDVPIDCTVENEYDFKSIDSFASAEGWFAAADYTPPAPTDGGAAPPDASSLTALWTSMSTSVGTGAVTSGGTSAYTGRMLMSIETPEDPLCGITNAAVFRASHNNDWGGMFGKWNFGAQDGSPFEGISFWARAPGKTTKAFTLLLDDENTASTGTTRCWVYSMNDGGVTEGQTDNTNSGTDPGTGTPITGSSNSRAAYRNECGNSFFSIVELTSRWTFYRIPFSRFKQTASPNRVPNTALPGADAGAGSAGTQLVTSQLRNLIMRMPKEAEMELWMAKLAFYGAKRLDAGGLTGEAGTPDAPVKPVAVDAPVKSDAFDAPAPDTLDAADTLDATNTLDADDAN